MANQPLIFLFFFFYFLQLFAHITEIILFDLNLRTIKMRQEK